jgi:hypothetical protein
MNGMRLDMRTASLHRWHQFHCIRDMYEDNTLQRCTHVSTLKRQRKESLSMMTSENDVDLSAYRTFEKYLLNIRNISSIFDADYFSGRKTHHCWSTQQGMAD